MARHPPPPCMALSNRQSTKIAKMPLTKIATLVLSTSLALIRHARHTASRCPASLPYSNLTTTKMVSEQTPLVVTSDGGSYTKNSSTRNDPESPLPAQRGAFEDATPSWREIMDKVTPFLRPADWLHSLVAIFALVSVLVGKVLNVLPPLAIKRAVDALSDASAAATATPPTSLRRQVLGAIASFFGLKLLVLLNSACQDLAQRYVVLDAERRFGVSAFAHLHHLGLSYHLEKHVGEVTRILNRGSDSVSTLINSFLFYLAPTVFEACIVSVVFWKLGTPAIAASTVAAVALYLTFTVVVTKTRIAYRRRLVESNDAVGRKETETLVNYETVSMFGRTKHETVNYGTLRKTYQDRRVDMLSMFALLELGQKFIRLCGVCAGLAMAGLAALGDDGLSTGSFVVIQMYIEQLFQPLTMLGFQYRMLTQSFTDLEKAVTMLHRVPEVREVPGAVRWKNLSSPSSMATVSGELVLRDVSFRYKVDSRHRALGSALNEPSRGPMGGRRGRMNAMATEEKVVKEKSDETINRSKSLGGVSQLSFKIPAGKTAALVGPSGSGKTTIIRLVLRMYDPDGGTVRIDGQDVRGLTLQSLRENIGVVAQETILFNASLRDNITYGKPDATEGEIWAAVRTAALEGFVKGLPNGIDTIVGERGMKLSGGERQRVGLARCVIKGPQLILLDEATSALDSATERDIQRNIADVCSGRTTLMIAHRLSTARHADEILVLDKGRICERGSHDDLLAMDGKYAKMWAIQTEPSA